jgi:hypothetical protein
MAASASRAEVRTRRDRAARPDRVDFVAIEEKGKTLSEYHARVTSARVVIGRSFD